MTVSDAIQRVKELLEYGRQATGLCVVALTPVELEALDLALAALSEHQENETKDQARSDQPQLRASETDPRDDDRDALAQLAVWQKFADFLASDPRHGFIRKATDGQPTTENK